VPYSLGGPTFLELRRAAGCLLRRRRKCESSVLSGLPRAPGHAAAAAAPNSWAAARPAPRRCPPPATRKRAMDDYVLDARVEHIRNFTAILSATRLSKKQYVTVSVAERGLTFVAVDDSKSLQVGPGSYCLPRHRMPFKSRNEASKCVRRRCGQWA